MEEIKNIGFNLSKERDDSSASDYVLGSTKPITGIGDPVVGLVGAVYAWPAPVNGIYPRTLSQINHAVNFISSLAKKYLPIGTVQRGSQDWMNCATNAPCNELEKQFNYALEMGLFSQVTIDWFKKVGFINLDNGKFEIADAFNTILSGTTENGNSLKAPIESIRTDGIIPKSMLPDDKSMSFAEYHNKERITKKLFDLGKEIFKYVDFGYEKVYYDDFPKFLDVKWDAFDSYVDRVDGDFIKRLALDYNMMNYAYHLIINEVPQLETPKEEESMKLYNSKNVPKPYDEHSIFQFGIGDAKFHHIEDDEWAKAMYGYTYGSFVEEMAQIPSEQIGFPLPSKKTFLQYLVTLLSSKSKGRR